MGAEVSFDGPRVAVQIVNPGVVALLLNGDGLPFVFAPSADEQLLDPGQLRFDSAQAPGDGVILLRHLLRDGCLSDCREGCLG